MDNEQLKSILEAVMSLPAMQWCAQQMEKSQQEPEKLAYSEEEKVEGEPGEVLEEEIKDDEEVAPAKLRMQYDQARRKNAKLEADYKAMFAKVAQIEKDKTIADRKNELMQLEAEGYEFDMADEVETVSDLEPARFSKHIALMRKNYRRAPIGITFNNVVQPNFDQPKPKPYNAHAVMEAVHNEILGAK